MAFNFPHREVARQEGKNKYSTGKPCRLGHYAPRYTTTGACTSCITEYGKTYRASMNRPRAYAVYIYPEDLNRVLEYAKALKLARDLQRVIDNG